MMVLRPGVSKVRIDELTFSPDGMMLAAPAGADGVMLWTTFVNGTKAEVLKLPVKGVEHLAFSSDGTTLFAGNDQLCAFDLTKRKSHRFPIPAWGTLQFGVSNDGSHFVVAENPRGTEETRFTVWNPTDLSEPVSDIRSSSLVRMPPMLPPTGEHFLFVEDNRQPSRQWEFRRVLRSVETGSLLDRSEPLIDCPELTALSADGQMLACRTREVIRVYPAAGTWKEVPTIINNSKKHFTGVAFHPNNKFLAATSNDETVKLYDTATWQLARTFTWDIGRMRSICFSPDGTLAAAGSDRGKVVVWDVDV